MSTIALAPLPAAARLAGRRGRVLLDSGRDDDGCGAWSFLAADPVATLEVRGRRIVERDGAGRVVRDEAGDPLAAIDAFARAHGAPAARGPRASGVGPREEGVGPQGDDPRPRVMGFFGYDLGRAIERIGAGPARGADTPDVWLGAYDAVIRWPKRAGGDGEIVGVDAEAIARLARAIEEGPREVGAPPRVGALVADEDGDAHCARVEQIRAYIAAGDVYQVNLARRLTAPLDEDGDALALYAALGAIAPAPYGGLVETDVGVRVVSGSPERFLARAGAGHRLDTRPIKGTRRRTGDPSRDAALAADLAVQHQAPARVEHVVDPALDPDPVGRQGIAARLLATERLEVFALVAQAERGLDVAARPAAIDPDRAGRGLEVFDVAGFDHRTKTVAMPGERRRQKDIAEQGLAALFEAREDLTAFGRYRVPEMDTVRDVLVCTHGTVDAACAKFGYPLYNRLRRDYADEGLRVWRVSHFGGHVFAPTLVDLPTGHFWAYVEEAQVRPIVRREGSVEAMRGHYRGWAGLENPFLQAAEHEMWQREGWVWFEWVKTGRVVEADSGDRPTWAVVEVDYRSTDGSRAGCYRGRVTVEREVETIGTTGYEAVYPYAQYVVREMDHMVTTEPDMA